MQTQAPLRESQAVSRALGQTLPRILASLPAQPSGDWESPLQQTTTSPLAVIDSLRIVESAICGLDPQIEDST